MSLTDVKDFLAIAVSPAETRGPYPDTVGMINNASYFRRDITEGKPGTPLALTLTVANELLTVTGSPSGGYTAMRNVGIQV